MTQGLIWRKSSYSGGGVTNDCVEVAFGSADDVAYVRDSNKFSAAGWAGLVRAVAASRVGHTAPNL